MPVVVHIVMDVDTSKETYNTRTYKAVRGFFKLEDALRLRFELERGRKPREPEEGQPYVQSVEVE